jgi:hypothetical protein
MAGILSKGMTLSYKTTSEGSYVALTNLQNIPDLGGTADSIEITTFDDAAHTYMEGLLNFGDSVDFTFLYDKTQFATLNALTGEVYWQVGIPDGTNGAVSTVCTFQGACSVGLVSVGTNSPITYTLSIKPSTAMTFA